MRLRERLRAVRAPGRPVLVVTAVAAERETVRRGLRLSGDRAEDLVTVEAVGVGPAAAAAGTARLLTLAEAAGVPYPVVVCAGIAGGFAPQAGVGATVLATRAVAADLGADSPDGFTPLSALGLGPSTVDVDADVLAARRERLPHALVGEVLTVGTVTGTAARADELRVRHPHAAAEAMEGFGVGLAAERAGVAFAEIRTIANPVGPRDRAAWRIDEALTALAAAAAGLAAMLDLAP
jgi:futalosine hydrolase